MGCYWRICKLMYLWHESPWYLVYLHLLQLCISFAMLILQSLSKYHSFSTISEVWHNIGMDTEIEVRMASSVTRQSHHTPKPRGVVRLPCQGWRHSDLKSRYQFLFYHDATNHTKYMQSLASKNRNSPENCFESATIESTAANHCHSSLLRYALVAIVT